MNNAITVEKLKKSYAKGFWLKRSPVLKDISYQIPEGKVTGFLGSNGSGKTTTLKCILDLVRFDSGKIQIFGVDSRNASARKDVGFLPERPYFYEYLTGREFLEFYGGLSSHMSRKLLRARIDDVLKKVDLLHARDNALRTYSKGMLQRIGVGQAILHEPKLLMLDEPMSGSDPDGRAGISSLIREIAQTGTTVFFSTHLIHDVEKLCEQILILRQGTVAYNGSKQDLLGSLQNRYIVHWSRQGVEKEEIVPDLVQAQATIDRLRQEKANILELRADRPTLESIYLDISKSDKFAVGRMQ